MCSYIDCFYMNKMIKLQEKTDWTKDTRPEHPDPPNNGRCTKGIGCSIA